MIYDDVDNDRFVPALRPLKQTAMIFYAPKPKLVRLTARLRYIADRETLMTDSRALLALCEMTEGDVRSCLNTMQVG